MYRTRFRAARNVSAIRKRAEKRSNVILRYLVRRGKIYVTRTLQFVYGWQSTENVGEEPDVCNENRIQFVSREMEKWKTEINGTPMHIAPSVCAFFVMSIRFACVEY